MHYSILNTNIPIDKAILADIMSNSNDIRVWATQLRKGAAELCVLACLYKGEAYGYELMRRLKRYPGLSITEGTLYPLLSRAAESGYVALEHRPSSSGPPRRYYSLTQSGKDRLNAMRDAWRELGVSIGLLLEEQIT